MREKKPLKCFKITPMFVTGRFLVLSVFNADHGVGCWRGTDGGRGEESWSSRAGGERRAGAAEREVVTPVLGSGFPSSDSSSATFHLCDPEAVFQFSCAL